MKFSLAILPILASISGVLAGVPVLSEYVTLWDLCEDGGPAVYVGVLYEGDYRTTFSYDQCYPYVVNNANAVMAVFCRSVACFNNPCSNCTGGAFPPVPVPIPAGTTLVNAAQWVLLLGQGATCTALL